MKNKIVAFGEIVWDMLPTGKQIGGAPLNFAFFSMSQETLAYIISAIGCDTLGRETIDTLSNTRIDLTYVQRNSLPTGKVLIEVDANGFPKYEIMDKVAWDSIESDPKIIEFVKDSSVFCWGSLAQRSETSRNTLITLLDVLPRECLKVFDINIRQNYYSREIIENSLIRANVLKLNEDELPLVAEILGIRGKEGDIVKILMHNYSLTYLIYTHGADFSKVYTYSGEISHLLTPKVEVKDTVGAGDSFTATFVTSLLNGESLTQSHAKAVEVAAQVCSKHGAIL